MLRHAGVSTEELALVKADVQKFGVAREALQLDDALVHKVVIAGTPDQLIMGLRRFLGSGLKLPIVWEIIGPDRRHSLSLIAKEVMPGLCRRT